jgi:hypothetical protein
VSQTAPLLVIEPCSGSDQTAPMLVVEPCSGSDQTAPMLVVEPCSGSDQTANLVGGFQPPDKFGRLVKPSIIKLEQ